MASSTPAPIPIVEFALSTFSFSPKASSHNRFSLNTSHHSPAAEFTRFTQLPRELQIRVWEEVELEPRLIIIKERVGTAEPGPAPLLLSSTPVQPLLNTCSLSRLVALQSYKPTFQTQPRPSNAQVIYRQGETNNQGRYVHVNFDEDIFYFPDLGLSNRFPILVENSQEASKVKTIVFVGQERWPGLDWYMLACRVFPNLSHLFMVKHSLITPSMKEEEDHERVVREEKQKEFEEKVKRSTWMFLGDRNREGKGKRCQRDEEGTAVRWKLPGCTFLGDREFEVLVSSRGGA